MDTTFNQPQIQQIKDVFKKVLDEKMDWNIQEKLTNIENNLENYLKISRGTLKQMRDFNAKYAIPKKWYIVLMSDTIDYKRIQAIVESAIDMKVRQIVDEEITEKLTPLRNDIDKVLKIVSDTRQEQVLTQSKVDDHEVRITALESNFATV